MLAIENEMFNILYSFTRMQKKISLSIWKICILMMLLSSNILKLTYVTEMFSIDHNAYAIPVI